MWYIITDCGTCIVRGAVWSCVFPHKNNVFHCCVSHIAMETSSGLANHCHQDTDWEQQSQVLSILISAATW
jgi:hypothetical protein